MSIAILLYVAISEIRALLFIILNRYEAEKDISF
jgi:hypothetical protein